MRYGNFFDAGTVGMGQVVIAGETYTAPAVKPATTIWGKIGEMASNVVAGLTQKLPEVGTSTLTALATSKLSESIFGVAKAPALPAVPKAPAKPKAGVPGWVWPVGLVGVAAAGLVALKVVKRGKRGKRR